MITGGAPRARAVDVGAYADPRRPGRVVLVVLGVLLGLVVLVGPLVLYAVVSGEAHAEMYDEAYACDPDDTEGVLATDALLALVPPDATVGPVESGCDTDDRYRFAYVVVEGIDVETADAYYLAAATAQGFTRTTAGGSTCTSVDRDGRSIALEVSPDPEGVVVSLVAAADGKRQC
ncbi:hypothetical protein CLV28_0894 [Sediminihabitans luteus]|uniref:Uncharacterized protein n=1 Tax=Sediminihabitans luteus TaxID=1138585 RepID=A0A2M9D0H8_9CELL|nr:hypothetical protein [Sediminihabitans luteus]PJJ77669.1 hypothetical protein CLV28_0894 [Sediminihabitans luteus]GII98569.1 hypothetical protein Slu03_09470 [Sediminihabitans luteus]